MAGGEAGSKLPAVGDVSDAAAWWGVQGERGREATPGGSPAVGVARACGELLIETVTRSASAGSWHEAPHHDVSRIGTGRAGRSTVGRISVTRSRPRWQTAQSSMSIPVRRSIRVCTDSIGRSAGAGGWSRTCRHRASVAWRVRLARRPKWR